ncbi:MAG: metal-dependent hydrolase [Thermoleophilia bacterium]|nr:metal-dependent hydrolase [Thermoleophilia bacterium]
MPGVSVTWLGHATFRIDSPGGKRIYLDPWLSNPSFPEGEPEPDRIDVMAITHGHSDHVGEAVELGKRFSPQVVAIFELAAWLESQGVAGAASGGMNKGGTQEVDGIRFTMTNAVHSSGFSGNGEPVYLGEPAGFVIQFENGTKLYFAGDTAVMSDMQLIGRLYEPAVAVLPVGDHFTMGPREAALAVELLGANRMLACHYGTFPLLTGTPEECRKLVSDCEVLAPKPGETIEL